jgi:anaerobic selenocysteine-containing dehydrogenase
MTSHHVDHRRTWRSWVPFGIGQVKPTHFRDMARIVWENRDNLGYAWKVITKGVCDGCALGVAGLKDLDGKGAASLHDAAESAPAQYDAGAGSSSARGRCRADDDEQPATSRAWPTRLPDASGAWNTGFRRITWDEAYSRIAQRIRATDPRRVAFFVTSRGVTNEVYYMAQKVARFLGTNRRG